VAWSKSAIFRAWLESALRPTPNFSGGWNRPYTGPQQVGAYHVSLWTDGNTPDETAPANLTGLAVVGGQWERYNPPPTGVGMDSTVAGNTGPALGAWPPGGPPVPGTGQLGGFTSAGGLITFGGGNPVSAAPCVMHSIVGDMVFHFHIQTGAGLAQYQGLAFHYYGGAQRVTQGTFTVVWPPERVAQIQLV
jgi:hypothetical protein